MIDQGALQIVIPKSKGQLKSQRDLVASQQKFLEEELWHDYLVDIMISAGDRFRRKFEWWISDWFGFNHGVHFSPQDMLARFEDKDEFESYLTLVLKGQFGGFDGDYTMEPHEFEAFRRWCKINKWINLMVGNEEEMGPETEANEDLNDDFEPTAVPKVRAVPSQQAVMI